MSGARSDVRGGVFLCCDDVDILRGPEDTLLVNHLERTAYRLDGIGVAIGERLTAPTTIGAVSEGIAATFDVQVDECAPAVDRFVRNLQDLGLVEAYDAAVGETGLRRRYLDLLARALTNLIYPEHELRVAHLEQHPSSGDDVKDQRLLRDIRYADPEMFHDLVEAKREGLVWRRQVTRDSHTMVGLRRLENLERCAARVFADGVPGDFLEAGACQGGASIFLRALQVSYGEPHRTTWVADSFEGLPQPSHPVDVERFPGDFSETRQPWLAVSLRSVQDNFRTYDLLSDRVRFLPGWFAESLPAAPVGPLAILRVDADLYSSTYDVLSAMYDRVSVGGYVVIDDYWTFQACRMAVQDFLAERGIEPRLRRIDWAAVFWRKTT